jgi:Ca2+:H+ antiporter
VHSLAGSSPRLIQLRHGTNLSVGAQVLWVLRGSYLNLLLVLIPFTLIAYLLNWNSKAQFALNFFAIIPLARLLGIATEEFAMYTNQAAAALINATFGNAVELIIGIICVKEDWVTLAQTSLLGSILSNLLLVLGCSFLAGGYYYSEQKFNMHLVGVYSSMTGLAVMALLIPAAYVAASSSNDTMEISHGTAVILLIIYGLYLVYQLRTHKGYYSDVELQEEEDQEPETPTLSLYFSVVFLFIIAIVVSLCCEALIEALQDGYESWNLSETFLGLILLPVIGNAAEHASAVILSTKNKMTLSVGIALGSSLQIALFVTPLLVIVSWILGKGMSLYFNLFETAVLFISVLIVNYVIGKGRSDWFQGVLCIGTYCSISIAAFYFRPLTP